jgi:hypothetical protein
MCATGAGMLCHDIWATGHGLSLGDMGWLLKGAPPEQRGGSRGLAATDKAGDSADVLPVLQVLLPALGCTSLDLRAAADNYDFDAAWKVGRQPCRSPARWIACPWLIGCVL